MNTLELENQWEKVEFSDESVLSYIRIDGKCIPDLNLAINMNKHRCLMLKIPQDYLIPFKGEEKENIKTSFSKKGNYILLELLDNYYHTLFNDLIISLYYKIRHIQDYKESTETFIITINKWSSFLKNSKGDKLSRDVVTGLYGELTVLREYLNQSDSITVNDILKAWKGPYNSNTDFVFENSNIEVKTKNESSTAVKISSEFQLDDETGKSLKLMIVSVDTVKSPRETLSIIIDSIRDKIIELNGDLSILLDTISQKGLFISNLNEYDEYKFNLKSHVLYDCDATIDQKSFPRIKKSELPDELKKVIYEISLGNLKEFITYTKVF